MPTTKRSPCFQRSSHHLPHLLSCWSRDTALPVCKRTTWVIYKCRFNKINVVMSWRNGFSISPFPIPVSSDTTLRSSRWFFFFSFPLCAASQERHTALHGTLCSARQAFPFAMDVLTLPTRKHLPFLTILTIRATAFQYQFPWQPWITSY